MFQNILIIINPASGWEEPILSYLNKVLSKHPKIKWEIAVTKEKTDPYNFAKSALNKNYDLIAVYGGDGTVREVARALYKQKIPLLILPGGTANVMAKELGIPEDSREAAKLLVKEKPVIKKIDMALLKEEPFLLRIDIGILAEIVKDTDRDSKEKFGRLAYSVTALKKVIAQDIYKFEMNIDGKIIKETGVALMIANAGNIGITGYSLLPHIKVQDGYLDVVILKTTEVRSLLTLLKTIITGKKPHGTVKHWKGKEIGVKVYPESEALCDDIPVAVQEIKTKVAPQSLKVVVP